jgi:CRISPR-associated protein Csm1
MNSTLREKIYLAALLHDIGKFYQRADDNGMVRSTELDQTVKNLESIVCPVNKDGFYTHKHVLWTAQFIEDIGIDNQSSTSDTILRLASYHHKPSTFHEAIIQLADHLSSGMDRTKAEAQDDENDTKNWDHFKKVRMKSVFDVLFKEKQSDYTYELPVGELDFSKEYFPKNNFNEMPDYREVWNKFVMDVKFIQTDNGKAWAETFLFLLEKYSSTVPSSTIDLPDISLFDHLKTTAAFAISLFDYANEKEIKDISELKMKDAPFLLIGADVSGIQSYIYDIISKNAAKNLKGRSFYLQLLTDSIIQKLIKELELFQSNVVYNSGGGFYIIAPNTEFVRETLAKITREITDKIFQQHKTSLFIAFDSEELTQTTIFNQEINITWMLLNEKLSAKKRQRFKEILVEDYDYFFEPTGGKQVDRDDITGEEFEAGEKIIKNKDIQLRQATVAQIELGKKLKKAVYWITSEHKISYWKGQDFEPCNLGIYHYFIHPDELSKKKETLAGSLDNARVMRISEADFLEGISGKNNIYGFFLYGGNDFPVDEDGITPKTFNELGGEGSFKRIAVLRMDVDNLGSAFIRGFTDGRKTFSRYSVLSRNLDFFFKGYLNTIWKEEKYKNHTFIVYSGGDDLFIVGRWDLIFEMAMQINHDFREWTCHNPALTLSGGIAIVDEKYPIMKGAEEAGKAEDKAKRFKFNDLEKNALTIFDHPVSWDYELPIILGYKDRIKTLLNVENGLPKAFASKIFSYNENTEFKIGENISPLNVLWMMAYDFGRMEKRIKNQQAKELLTEIKNNVFTNSYNNESLKSNYHILQLINLAVRWAELEIRTNK